MKKNVIFNLLVLKRVKVAKCGKKSEDIQSYDNKMAKLPGFFFYRSPLMQLTNKKTTIHYSDEFGFGMSSNLIPIVIILVKIPIVII